MKRKLNSTYLVAKFLISHRKSYIHDLKRVCKCNNPMQRILKLRRSGWKIDTIFEGYKDGKAIYHYKLICSGSMPNKIK